MTQWSLAFAILKFNWEIVRCFSILQQINRTNDVVFVVLETHAHHVGEYKRDKMVASTELQQRN